MYSCKNTNFSLPFHSNIFVYCIIFPSFLLQQNCSNIINYHRNYAEECVKQAPFSLLCSGQWIYLLTNELGHCLSKDTTTLGTVIVRHQGYTVLVEAAGPKPEEGEELPTDLAINEQIDGGANALNVNRSHTFHPPLLSSQFASGFSQQWGRHSLLGSRV